MQPVPFNPGLSHRLLVAVARAHYDGAAPLDWEEIAHDAGVSASPRAVDRALGHLADAGLIEGISTPAGWLAVRPTARGLGRAGRAARRPLAADPAPAPIVEAAGEPPEPLEAVARERVVQDLRRAGAAAAEARDRLSRTLSPRIATVRTTMAQAWHTFTTIP